MGKSGNPANKVRYWHGGVPGLKPGQALEAPLPGSPVYVTTNRDLGLAFAARHAARSQTGSAGTLYEVVDVRGGTPDPDFALITPNPSFRCRSAKILRIGERAVVLPFETHERLIAPMLKWDDGTAHYDVEGYINPQPEWKHAQHRIRELGTWAGCYRPRTQQRLHLLELMETGKVPSQPLNQVSEILLDRFTPPWAETQLQARF